MNLFGITNDTTFKELKKSYYTYALLCHPDNGGTSADMQVVQQAYEEATSQLNQEHTSKGKMDRLLDTLEKGTLYNNTSLNEPCDTPFPSLRDIFDEVHDRFHSTCQEQQHEQHEQHDCHFLECYENDPYASQGYGSYMLDRWKRSEQHGELPVYTPDVDTTEAPPLPDIAEPYHPTQLVKHTVFQASTGYPVQVDTRQHVSDFTVSEDLFAHTDANTGCLPRSDYRRAFTLHPATTSAE